MPNAHQPRPSVSWDAHIRVPKSVLSQELTGEMVLLNLDTGTYFGLDPVGTRIWHLFEQGRSIKATYEAVLEEYEVDRQQLTRDLLRFVNALNEQGLIEDASPLHSEAR